MSGRGRYHPWLANLDMYRKVPVDLLEGSRQGSIISWIALIFMATLFAHETRMFLKKHVVTDLFLDSNPGRSRLKVNFNITMMDLRCEYATVNIVSVLGKEQNITKDIRRFTVDADGVHKLVPQRKDAEQQNQDLAMHDPSVTESLESLHENGEDAISLDADTLDYALEEYEFVFVEFYASWCSHCQALAPTWERLAEVMHDASDGTGPRKPDLREYSSEDYNQADKLDKNFPVVIAKVDCVDYDDLCDEQDVMGYPTLILFVNGERYEGGEYYGDRTVTAFLQFLLLAEERTKQKDDGAKIKQHAEMAVQKHLNMTQDHRQWLEAMDRSRHHHGLLWNPEEHPGCTLVGSLLVDRVTGNFYIQAQSQNHNIDPRMTNLSHQIHHLSFENPEHKPSQSHYYGNGDRDRSRTFVLPKNLDRTTKPMNGRVYVVENLHQAYHHYFKIVRTNENIYQLLPNSQLAFYRSDHVPEAKFMLDFSPIAVNYRNERLFTWYDYMTKLFAIIGGTFTVVGMVESAVRVATRRVSRIKQKHGRAAA